MKMRCEEVVGSSKWLDLKPASGANELTTEFAARTVIRSGIFGSDDKFHPRSSVLINLINLAMLTKNKQHLTASTPKLLEIVERQLE